MFNNKSIYALNKKDRGAIVYIDAEGEIQRLTREDFSSEDSFRRWKEWSDEDYHTSEKAGHVYANHTISLTGLSEEVAAVPSPEERFVGVHEREEQERRFRLLREALDTCLTPIQRRRLWLYSVEGVTVRQIAKGESVRFQNVAKSIAAAKKKVKTFFEKQGDKTPF